MTDKLKIGFFDSGVGGISVMACAKKHLPDIDYVYYADTAHVPYGTKTQSEIILYSDNAIQYLISSGVSAVVIACNTATSMAVDYLRSKYSIPIIGMEPAVKTAAEIHPGEEILVCATPATISGAKLHTLIDKTFTEGIAPTLVPLPKLVTFAENGTFDDVVIYEYLSDNIDKCKKYSSVVLGCTHFSYFKDSFKKYLGNIDIIDGTMGTIKRLSSIIDVEFQDNISDKQSTNTIYVRSGCEVVDKETLDFYSILEKKAFM